MHAHSLPWQNWIVTFTKPWLAHVNNRAHLQADQQAAGAAAVDAKSGKDGKPRVEVGSLEEVLVGAAMCNYPELLPWCPAQHGCGPAEPSPASVLAAAACGQKWQLITR